MRFPNLSAVAILAVTCSTTASAANHFVRDSLSQLSDATVSFDNTLARWNGNFASLAPILLQSSDLITAIKTASSVPRDATTDEVLSGDEDQVFVLANNIAKDIKSAVDTTIGLQPKLEAIPQVGKPIALAVTRNIRNAVSELTQTYVGLASENRREEARTLMKKIDDDLARAMSVYE